MKIEWNKDLMGWVWRIYVDDQRTSAFIPFKDGERPEGVTQAQYNEAAELMRAEDEKPF